MPTDPDVMLILRPVRDPEAGPGFPARPADYRLKLALKVLLRSYGLRAVSVGNAPHNSQPPELLQPVNLVKA